MKRLFLLALLAVSACATQSLSAGTGSVTLPNASPYTSESSWRIEFRAHGSYTQGITQQIFGTSEFDIRTIYGGFTITSWPDGSSACTTSGVPDGTDVIIRLQRTSVVNLTVEAFNAQTGVVLYAATCGVSVTGSPNDGGATVGIGTFNGDIAYIRVYNTTVAVGTLPGNTTCNGQLLDFEFEGSGNDCSGNGRNLTMSGANYVTTPSYPPAVNFNPYPQSTVFSTSSSLQLTSSSFSATDNATLTYAWSQVAPIPAIGSFSNAAISNPTFSSGTAGTYGIQLVVNDGSSPSTTALNIGAVNTNGTCGPTTTNLNCIVNDGLSPAMHNIIGPQLIANTTANPWTFDDIASMPTLQNIGAVGLAAPFAPALGTAITGTVTAGGYPTNGAVIVGSGTSFLTQLSVNAMYVVAWNSTDGAGTGRALCTITAITDNTHATCANDAAPFPSQSGLTMYNLLADAAGNICNGSPYYIMCWVGGANVADSIHYYDVPLALYRAYFRTGNTLYLNYAQQFADIVWQWVLDHGYGKGTSPRNMSMISQYYRALELGGSAETNRMAGLAITAGYLNTVWYNPPGIPYADLRDNVGYPLWFFAMGAKTDPNSSQHTTYCGYLTASTSVPTLVTAQNADGSYSEHAYVINPTYVDAPNTYTLPLVYESAPWRHAILARAMEVAYEVLADTSSAGCNQSTMAGTLLTAITNYVRWLFNDARDATNRGVFYELNSASYDQASVYHPAGTVSVSTSSPTVLTGSGTNWLTAGYCDGTHHIGIETPRTIYKIASCSSNTAAVLSPGYGSLYTGEPSTVSGSAYSIAPGAAACAPGQSSATWCGSGSGDRNLTRTVTAAVGWLYQQTHNLTYKTWADEFYSATMGGPTSGLRDQNNFYNFNVPCSGLTCDGYTGDSFLAAPTCGVPPGTAAPCGHPQAGGATQNFALHYGKDAGESWGAPGIDNWLAWRLAAIAAPALVPSTSRVPSKSLIP